MVNNGITKKTVDTVPGTPLKPSDKTLWVKIAKRKRIPKQQKERLMLDPAATRKTPLSQIRKATLVRKRKLRTSAVVSDHLSGARVTLTSNIKKIVKKINLKNRIQVRNVRSSRSGCIVLDVDDVRTAANLADKLRAVVKDQARVDLPMRRTSVLLLGIPDWCNTENVADGLIKWSATFLNSRAIFTN